MGEIGNGGATIGFSPSSFPGKFTLTFCDGSLERDGTAAGTGVWAAAGATDAVDGGILSSGAVPAEILPEGGGTGANKP